VQQEIYWVQCDLLVAAKPRSWSPPEPALTYVLEPASYIIF
jgi:hypothetical protein